MKKQLLLLICMSVYFTHSETINGQVHQWTLEECIEYAIENNIELKQRELEQQNREIILNTSKYSWLPNLNGSLSEDFGFGRTLIANQYENANNSSTYAYLGMSMPLFDGFNISNDIAARKLDLLASIESLNKAKEDLAMNVTSYYLQVLYTTEILNIAELQVILTQEQVDVTSAMVDAGKVPLSQLYDIKAQLANNEVSLIEAKNNVELALLDLAQALELERSEQQFSILIPDTDNAIEKYMGSILPPENIYYNAVTFKPQIKEQEYLLESQKKELKIAQAGYYPKLNLNASLNTRYFHYYGDSFGESNQPFGKSLKDNFGQAIGFSLSIPIFNRFQVRNSVRSAKIGILNRELVMDNTKKVLYKEIQQAYYNATAAQEKFIASGKSVEATEEAYKYAEERYNAGKSTAYEFNEVKTNYARSLSEQAQAKYNFIFLAKILDFYNGIPIKL